MLSCQVRTNGKETDMANQNQNQNEGNDKRGFASMDDEKQREIAKKGGQSVPDEKRSFSQDPDLASEAGRKGGQESGGDRR
jgi:general stress protein YciG